MKPYYEHAGITIYHGDCREVMPALEIAAKRLSQEMLPLEPAAAEPEQLELNRAGGGPLV